MPPSHNPPAQPNVTLLLVDAIGHLIEQSRAQLEQSKAEFEWFKSHLNCATKQDLKEMENRLHMEIQEAIDAMTELSTASDGLSIKMDGIVTAVDKLVVDTGKLITLITSGGTKLTPAQEAAVATVRASSAKATAATASGAAEGDKVDAAVAAADAVLPTPAPAGTL